MFPTEWAKSSWRPHLIFASVGQAQAFSHSPLNYNSLEVLEGAEALGYASDYDAGVQAECNEVIEAVVPELKGKLQIDPTLVPAGEPNYASAASTDCRYLTLFRLVATAAGADLNYQTLQDAFLHLGAVDLPADVEKTTYSSETPFGSRTPVRFTYHTDDNTFRVANG